MKYCAVTDMLTDLLFAVLLYCSRDLIRREFFVSASYLANDYEDVRLPEQCQ